MIPLPAFRTGKARRHLVLITFRPRPVGVACSASLVLVCSFINAMADKKEIVSSSSHTSRTRLRMEDGSVHLIHEEQTIEITRITGLFGGLSIESSSPRRRSSCTYGSTKTSFKQQKFYRCYDCFTGDNLGVCEGCKDVCHKGHRVKYEGFMTAYCDCGLKTCRIDCSLGSKCTYDQFEYNKPRGYYECWTCWGGDSCFGVCSHCADDCHSGHRLIYHSLGENERFYCDCGKYKHKQAVCTYASTGREFVKQPFYRCYTCIPDPHGGCCYQCMKNCHRGHIVKYAGVMNAFCDCGLDGCAILCKISSP